MTERSWLKYRKDVAEQWPDSDFKFVTLSAIEHQLQQLERKEKYDDYAYPGTESLRDFDGYS